MPRATNLALVPQRGIWCDERTCTRRRAVLTDGGCGAAAARVQQRQLLLQLGSRHNFSTAADRSCGGVVDSNNGTAADAAWNGDDSCQQFACRSWRARLWPDNRSWRTTGQPRCDASTPASCCACRRHQLLCASSRTRHISHSNRAIRHVCCQRHGGQRWLLGRWRRWSGRRQERLGHRKKCPQSFVCRRLLCIVREP